MSLKSNDFAQSDSDKVTPCFTSGTVIATTNGEKPVETLAAGDMVITRDNGIQEIRWVGSREMNAEELRSNAHLVPVLIRAGALGMGLPERDMLVSPNHRMLIASDRTALFFEDREVFASAKHLINSRDIITASDRKTTYIHFMFERHEVVLANGAWTESFQPDDNSLKGIGNAQRVEILELFPELATRDGRANYGAARKTLSSKEAKLLAE
ncbi:Hint domain-containing protein [Falsihalocynthiibacter sp. SS001]|uniref:Hint domain-containing protein n=1 Tax=Falsihalocynthiibacter sp. SS001 TaxID=3349698 RepID=UPI0036D39816